MNCASRYIMRQLFWPLVFAVIAISGIIWMSQSLRFVDMVLNRGLPTATLFQMAFLILPMYTSAFLPLVLFGVVMFVYTKMSMDSELIIWRACGMGQLALARPAIILALLTMAFCYLLNLYGMPAAYREFKDLQAAMRDNYSQILLREGEFNETGAGLIVYVRDRNPQGELLGILIHDRREEGQPVTIMAESGALIQSENMPRVVLVNGNRQSLKQDGELSILYFDRYTLDLGASEETSGSRWRKPSERYLHELFTIDTTGPHAANERRFRLELLAEGHYRLTAPWLSVVYALIAMAALLTGDFDRRGKSFRIIGATVAVLGIQALSVSLHSLAGTTLAVMPLMYVLPLAAIGGSLWLLLREPKRSKCQVRNLTARV